MANYRETELTGSKWVRSNRVTCINPYNGTPFISFGEEEITLLSDGRTTNAPLGEIHQDFTDPSVEFPLLNPATGESIGTATYGQVYVILHSLYMALAATRDAHFRHRPAACSPTAPSARA